MRLYAGFAFAAFLILPGSDKEVAASQETHAPKTYYISSSSGDDSNEGQSPDRAWQHLSKIYLKSASALPFQPGDNILLKRGDQWDGQIRLQANGTQQKPITIGAYGHGQKPLLYGDNPQIRWESVAGHLGIYTADMGSGSILGSIFLKGKTVRAIYPGGSLNRREYLEAFLTGLQSGTLAGQYDGRLWVQTHENKAPKETVLVIRSSGVMLGNSSYVQIENLDIQRFYVGIDIAHSRRVLVRHNDIQDVLGIGIYLRLGDVNCVVESNTVFRAGNTALYVLKGSGNTLRDNWVSHVESTILGIHVSGDAMGVGLQESQQSLVEYNYFTHSGGMDFYYEQGSTVRYNYLYQVRSAGAPHGENLRVYGNIYNLEGQLKTRGSTGVNAVATGPGTIAVFNNTIFNASIFFLMGSSNKRGKIVFSDNIVSSTVPGGAMTVFGPNVSSNHNCFSSPGQPLFRYDKVNYTSLKKEQAGSGQDRDSTFADPEFVNSTPKSPLDFRIKLGSACNSSALDPPMAISSDGRTYDHDRPISGKPVIGALRADETAVFVHTCNSECFGHPVTVPAGVYLVCLSFSPSVLVRPGRHFSFVLNGRDITVEFELRANGLPEDTLRRQFLVRPYGRVITLEPGLNSETSMVSTVDITAFDTSHGEEVQIISW